MDATSSEISRWIQSARNGSPDDLGRLMNHCRTYLLLVADRHLSGAILAKADASDLVQETFLEAQQGFRSFKGNSEVELRAWLRKILTHHVTDFRRRYGDATKRTIKREVPLETVLDMETKEFSLVSQDPSPSERVIASEQSRILMIALARIPARYQQILILRHREGRSFPEITQKIGRTPEAVRKLWARAVMRLNREIQTLTKSK